MDAVIARPATGPMLDLALYRAATTLMVVATAEGVARVGIVAAANGAPPDWWAIPAAAGVAALVGVHESVTARASRWGVRLFGVVALVAIVATVLVPGHSGLVEYPPAWSIIMSGYCLTSVAIAPSAVAWLAPLFAWFTVHERLPLVGGWQASWEGLLFVATALLCAEGVRALHRANGWVSRAAEQAWAAQERLVRAGTREAEKRRWDGLVHDKVLGALRLAGRPDGRVDAAARELAGQAGVALRSPESQPSLPLGRAVREHAARLGLDVTVEVTGDCPDGELAAALSGAIGEALTNIERHSRARAARVEGRLAPRGVRVRVSEIHDGPGAREIPGDPRPRGTGTRVSIVERMRDAGGEAELTLDAAARPVPSWSSPGRPPPRAAPRRPPGGANVTSIPSSRWARCASVCTSSSG